MDITEQKLAVIDRAIKDYSKIAKQKKVFLTTLEKKGMHAGLCIYFSGYNFELAWNKIPKTPKFKKNTSYGWIYPEYHPVYYPTYRILNVKEIGIKERLDFLLQYREILPKYLQKIPLIFQR